jgi:2-keto-3-deoxy-L-rhamnonate aldolase RhmA
MNRLERHLGFRARVRGGEPLLGTFVKTPHPSVIEVLGLSGLDCVCIDAEHAPIDRSSLDTMLLAARAVDLPALVRVASVEPSTILNALDLGATGVVLPHIRTAAQAQAAAKACRFGPGGRGYAGSTRAAGFGTGSLTENLALGNATATVIAQIEDTEALSELDGIAGVDEIDSLFVGRMDLTVSLSETSPDAPSVIQAIEDIYAACRRHARSLSMFTPSVEEAITWRSRGAGLLLLQSDQSFLLSGARDLLRKVG